jgi:hypothetical protein
MIVHRAVAMHTAGAMQAMPGPQGAPSPAGWWHVPWPPPSAMMLQAPPLLHATRLLPTMPQGWPADATCVCAHCLVCVLQNPPCAPSQSVCAVHAPPAATGVLHVPPMQESERRQGWLALHALPEAAGPTHVPELHTSVAWQSVSTTHVAPALGCDAQVPHALFLASWQKLVEHCPFEPHGAPAASEPGMLHAEGWALSSASSHVSALMAAAHASMSSGDALVPPAARAGAHASAVLCAHVVASP